VFFGGELLGDRVPLVTGTHRDALAALGRGEQRLCYTGIRTTSKQRAGLIAARRRRLVITEVLEDLGSDQQRLGNFEDSSTLAGQTDGQVRRVRGSSRIATHLKDGGRR
jgi:hypothetical protein